jgi:hypothetical protein
MPRCSIGLQMGLAIFIMLSSGLTAYAQEFALQVGPPIAGNAQPAKSSLLVVRPGGCSDPAAAKITATAEGIVDGARRSVPLTLMPMSTPGVHAVPKDWAKSGVWIVNLVGSCAGKTAGAIVSIGSAATYRRDAVKLLAHPASAAEIDASLKALTTGGQQ